MSSITHMVYELPHELPKYLGPEDENILKISNLGEDICLYLVPSLPYKHKILTTVVRKVCKSRFQSFLVLFSFTGVLVYSNILPGIV